MNADLVALRANPFIVKITKSTTHASPPPSRASNGKRVIAANRKSARVDCASLWWAIELKLAVGDNGASAAILVVEDAILQCAGERAIGSLIESVSMDRTIIENDLWWRGGSVRTSCAVSRLCLRDGFSRVPISKEPSTVRLQPWGELEEGSIPSGTA